MKKLMKAMNFALYHEHLPDRIYYSGGNFTKLAVPHGIYPMQHVDEEVAKFLRANKKDETFYMSIVGNVRKEKNYGLAIKALQSFPTGKLIIAGAPASSSQDCLEFKALAEKLQVNHQIVWIERFLSDGELAAVIEASDLILLNYTKTFTSQSGILNLIAPYEKEVIISKGESSLYKIAEKFDLGIRVEPDQLDSLNKAIDLLINKRKYTNWTGYLQYASWKNQVDKVLNEIDRLSVERKKK